MSAPVCSRRVSAGITPAPGTTSRLPVWWGRTDWIEVEVRGALREHPDVCADFHVAADTVLSVARAMAAYADAQTGRNCRPTNERLVEAAKCSLSTVQRARRVLKALGLVVEVTAGRTNMTREQRLEAWERGSSHRAVAAEFALCSRGRRRPRLAVDNSPADLQVVDRDTPPVGQVVRASATEIRGSLQSTDATKIRAPRGAHTEKGSTAAARQLAAGVSRRVTWLRAVPTGRLVPLLAKFARADWTARDVELAIADRLAVLGMRVPAKLDRPWAYLAWVLRDVDPAERPSLFEDAHAAAERAHRRLQHAAACEHGVPGGDVVSPLTGQRGCPLCRTGRASASST